MDSPLLKKSPDTVPDVQRGGLRRRLLLLAAVLLAAAAAYVWLRPYLTLELLANHERSVRKLYSQQPLLLCGLAFLAYVAITGLSIPGATGLSLAYGWFFGFVRGLVLVSFASTAGATLAFLLSRYLFRDAVRWRFGRQLARFDEALRREGPYFLLTLRLLPVVPFFVINAVMGLTPMRAMTFWWASQIGMLPATAAFVYAGSVVPSLQTLAEKGVGAAFTPRQVAQLILALTLLALVPPAARFAARRLWRSLP